MADHGLHHLILDDGLRYFGNDPLLLRNTLAEREGLYVAGLDKSSLVGQSIYVQQDLIDFYQATDISKNALKRKAEGIAPKILCAIKAYSAFIQELVDTTYGPGNYIRFTPNKNHKELHTKFPITLLLGQFTLPWNGFVVITRTSPSITLVTNTAQIEGKSVSWQGLTCILHA